MSNYRKTFENNLNLTNPNRFQGFKYAVHHLITQQAAKNHEKFLVTKIGYDINCIENLEGYPWELEGACHLEMQLHRGPHNVEQEGDGSEHPKSYKEEIDERLTNAIVKFTKNLKKIEDCKIREKDKKKFIQTLNDISEKIKKDIEKYKLKLTSIAIDFKKGNVAGCRGRTGVGESENECPHKRNHIDNTGKIIYNI